MVKVLRNEESKLQKACVKWFQLQYPRYKRLLFHVPNGGYRTATTARNMKLEGVVAGVADLILLVPSRTCHGLCIEMKTPKGRQTPRQKQWQEAVKAMGYRYEIARSIEEFMNIIDYHFND